MANKKKQTEFKQKTELEKAQEILIKAKAEKEQFYINKLNDLLKEMQENGVRFEIKPQITITAL